MTVYLNSSSHGLPSSNTMARMQKHLAREAEIGPFAAFEEVEPEYTHVRHLAARLIGAEPEDIGFGTTTFATWLPIAASLSIRSRRILVAPHEWGDNLRMLHAMAANAGATLEILPPLDLQKPDLTSWVARIDEDVAAIFTPMVTSAHGHRYPVEAIGALPRPDTCAFIVDAAQALGQTPIDVKAINCTGLTATCRKWLRGPRGTAIFWLARGGSATPALEPFDANVALRLGLGTTLRDTLEAGVSDIALRITALRDLAYRGLMELDHPALSIHRPQTGALSISLPTTMVEDLRSHLAANGITAKFPGLSHDEPNAPEIGQGRAVLRITPNVYNTEAEIAALLAAVKAAPIGGKV